MNNEKENYPERQFGYPEYFNDDIGDLTEFQYESPMTIGIIGAGRLGICFALLLERIGLHVIVSDIRFDYVSDINSKKINTAEPFVNNFLKTSKNLIATTDNLEVVKKSNLIFTFVATPSLENGSYDVSSVWDIIEEIKNAPFNVGGKTLVIGCTTNPGDCDLFEQSLELVGVDVIYNPEFIAQGSIIRDIETADMVLIGGKNTFVMSHLCEIYDKIQQGKSNCNMMSSKSAEIVKLATNCYLTTKISYANLIGQVMIKSGLESEIQSVLRSIGDDSRIGRKFLKYGFGFGGPCLPRDNRSFANYAKKLGIEYNIGTTIDNFNNEHSKFLSDYYSDKGDTFFFRYVTYKEGVDLVVESQQYKLAIDLLKQGKTVWIENITGIDTNTLKVIFGDKIKFGIPNEYYIEIDIL